MIIKTSAILALVCASLAANSVAASTINNIDAEDAVFEACVSSYIAHGASPDAACAYCYPIAYGSDGGGEGGTLPIHTNL